MNKHLLRDLVNLITVIREENNTTSYTAGQNMAKKLLTPIGEKSEIICCSHDANDFTQQDS
jgi:hypothetical protein